MFLTTVPRTPHPAVPVCSNHRPPHPRGALPPICILSPARRKVSPGITSHDASGWRPSRFKKHGRVRATSTFSHTRLHSHRNSGRFHLNQLFEGIISHHCSHLYLRQLTCILPSWPCVLVIRTDNTIEVLITDTLVVLIHLKTKNRSILLTLFSEKKLYLNCMKTVWI